MVSEVSSNELKDLLKRKKLLVLDCYAPWCKFCKMLEPILKQASEDLNSNNINFYKLNTDENLDFAKDYDIMSLPTILIFKEGKVINRKSGFVNAQDLKKLIES